MLESLAELKKNPKDKRAIDVSRQGRTCILDRGFAGKVSGGRFADVVIRRGEASITRKSWGGGGRCVQEVQHPGTNTESRP